jgi:hypothetical protein
MQLTPLWESYETYLSSFIKLNQNSDLIEKIKIQCKNAAPTKKTAVKREKENGEAGYVNNMKANTFVSNSASEEYVTFK